MRKALGFFGVQSPWDGIVNQWMYARYVCRYDKSKVEKGKERKETPPGKFSSTELNFFCTRGILNKYRHTLCSFFVIYLSLKPHSNSTPHSPKKSPLESSSFPLPPWITFSKDSFPPPQLTPGKTTGFARRLRGAVAPSFRFYRRIVRTRV